MEGEDTSIIGTITKGKTTTGGNHTMVRTGMGTTTRTTMQWEMGE